MLFDEPTRETIQLGSLTVPRLFVGLWQLSGPGWGTTSPARIRREMLRHVEAGYNAFGKSHFRDKFHEKVAVSLIFFLISKLNRHGELGLMRLGSVINRG